LIRGRGKVVECRECGAGVGEGTVGGHDQCDPGRARGGLRHRCAFEGNRRGGGDHGSAQSAGRENLDVLGT
jgi:hypothetical protein